MPAVTVNGEDTGRRFISLGATQPSTYVRRLGLKGVAKIKLRFLIKHIAIRQWDDPLTKTKR